MEEINGYVTEIVFRNCDNGYSVFTVKTDKGPVDCVGIVSKIKEGMNVKVTGDFQKHPVAGKQLKINEITIIH